MDHFQGVNDPVLIKGRPRKAARGDGTTIFNRPYTGHQYSLFILGEHLQDRRKDGTM